MSNDNYEKSSSGSSYQEPRGRHSRNISGQSIGVLDESTHEGDRYKTLNEVQIDDIEGPGKPRPKGAKTFFEVKKDSGPKDVKISRNLNINIKFQDIMRGVKVSRVQTEIVEEQR